MARKSGHEKKVLLLRVRGGGYMVCDEYYPTDGGRVHILGDHAYATFDCEQMVLDYKKAAIEISLVAYSATAWPGQLGLSPSRREILSHFGVQSE